MNSSEPEIEFHTFNYFALFLLHLCITWFWSATKLAKYGNGSLYLNFSNLLLWPLGLFYFFSKWSEVCYSQPTYDAYPWGARWEVVCALFLYVVQPDSSSIWSSTLIYVISHILLCFDILYNIWWASTNCKLIAMHTAVDNTVSSIINPL